MLLRCALTRFVFCGIPIPLPDPWRERKILQGSWSLSPASYFGFLSNFSPFSSSFLALSEIISFSMGFAFSLFVGFAIHHLLELLIEMDVTDLDTGVLSTWRVDLASVKFWRTGFLVARFKPFEGRKASGFLYSKIWCWMSRTGPFAKTLLLEIYILVVQLTKNQLLFCQATWLVDHHEVAKNSKARNSIRGGQFLTKVLRKWHQQHSIGPFR